MDVELLFNTAVILGVSVLVLFGYIVYLLRDNIARAKRIAEYKMRDINATTAHLRRLYDESPVPYLTLLPNGTIHNPNRAAMRLYGMLVEELEGRDFFEMHPEEDSEQAQSLRARFRSHVPFEREEIRIVRKAGSARWVMLSVFLFRPPGERARHGLATLVDITEQKNLDRAKTEFVSLASHQLRTPLATVKWHTELLLSGKHGALGEKQREYVEKVRRGNQVMVDLVELLLNVSRLEMGTLSVDVQDTSVSELVQDVLEELEPQVKEKSLAIEKQYDQGFQSIQTDKRLLRIVVQNLLSNAVKYTPEHGRVVVTLARQEGHHAIIVADTGYGIPADQQLMIFSKMFRADNIRKKSVDGNGLGLYLVKSIVELLGGTISFTSELDKGSIFTVLLP